MRAVVGTVVAAVVLAAAAVAGATAAEPCEAEEVGLLAGASRPSTVGVVEYEVIASGVVSADVVVGAARRIWGDVRVDRWVVVPSEQVGCGLVPTEPGRRFHRFVAAEGVDPTIVPAPPTELDLDALGVVLAEPVDIEVGSVDRIMAFLRVNWALLAVAGSAVVLAVAVVVRRRAGRARGDYLF